MKNKIVNIILVLILIVGLGLLLYPTFSDYYNSFHQSRAISSYVQEVSNMSDETYRSQLEAAQTYNADLISGNNRFQPSREETDRYNELLNITETGIMAYVEIPKIGVSLPVYHGTNEEVLHRAIGHLQGTSLPVGGTGTHCVLSGHRGLPSARLFTDIDQLNEGDLFMIETLGDTLTYQVDQIRIVLPSDFQELQIEEDADYCTLVTCTPYGINTHRLLVRGHRVENAKTQAHVVMDAMQIDPWLVAVVLIVVVLTVLFLGTMLFGTGRKEEG